MTEGTTLAAERLKEQGNELFKRAPPSVPFAFAEG